MKGADIDYVRNVISNGRRKHSGRASCIVVADAHAKEKLTRLFSVVKKSLASRRGENIHARIMKEIVAIDI